MGALAEVAVTDYAQAGSYLDLLRELDALHDGCTVRRPPLEAMHR